MPRNPIARALPAHRQQIIPDKRDRTLRQLWNEEIERGLTEDERDLLKRLS